MSIEGKTLLFTGECSKKKNEMLNEARSKGANVRSAFSKKLDFLVCCQKCAPGKIQKAKEHGIEIIDEAEYLRRLHSENKEK